MEFAFQDEFGHQMLNALRELGEGINKLKLIAKLTLYPTSEDMLRGHASISIQIPRQFIASLKNATSLYDNIPHFFPLLGISMSF